MLASGIDLHKPFPGHAYARGAGVTTREAALRSDRAAVMADFGTLTTNYRYLGA
jgi:hypothetical protein